MRIVYCIGSLAKPGGTERVLASKVNYMVEKLGYEIHILIIDQRGAPLCYNFSSDIQIHDMAISKMGSGGRIPGITYQRNILRLRKQYDAKISEINPDVVVAVERGYHDYVIPYINKSIPKVREFHFSKGAVKLRAQIMKPWVSSVRYRIMYSRLYKQFKKYDKLVLLTPGDKKASNYGPNAVVIENMLETFPKDTADFSSKNVISVGSMFDDRKGFHKQILMWKDIMKDFPDWKLNIYGDGPRFDYLSNLVRSEGLQETVILHGRSNEIPQKLLESSIFIMTSEAEGLPMVLIEAMSAGVPCVSYDCPTGPADIIADDKDGYLVTLNDEAVFKSKLKQLMGDEKRRREMGVLAKENAKRYLPESIMPKWENLFKELTATKK